MKLTFLGQAGFLIEFEEMRFLIDPYLSDYVVSSGIGSAQYFSREFEPPFAPSELGSIDAVFITHDHADHCDPLTLLPILVHNPECKVYGSFSVAEHLKAAGIHASQLHTLSVGKPARIGSVLVASLPSAHYGLDRDPVSGEFPYLGFLFNFDGITLYHSGDTVFYEGMVESLVRFSPRYDVVCLPVNGRDKTREALDIKGNLTPAEALELAAKIKADLLIPMHNDLFKINSMDPNILDELRLSRYPVLNVSWLKAGETIFVK